jgi:hypothetical protein
MRAFTTTIFCWAIAATTAVAHECAYSFQIAGSYVDTAERIFTGKVVAARQIWFSRERTLVFETLKVTRGAGGLVEVVHGLGLCDVCRHLRVGDEALVFASLGEKGRLRAFTCLDREDQAIFKRMSQRKSKR